MASRSAFRDQPWLEATKIKLIKNLWKSYIFPYITGNTKGAKQTSV